MNAFMYMHFLGLRNKCILFSRLLDMENVTLYRGRCRYCRTCTKEKCNNCENCLKPERKKACSNKGSCIVAKEVRRAKREANQNSNSKTANQSSNSSNNLQNTSDTLCDLPSFL